MTPRLPDWQLRLSALLEARRAAPFAWGAHDCVSFAADAVMAVTGQDPGAGERGYTDELGAAVGLRKFGGVSGIGDALFGVLVPVLLSRVGDVGLVTSEGRDSLAVCNGDTWLAPGADGLVALPLRAATRAWRF